MIFNLFKKQDDIIKDPVTPPQNDNALGFMVIDDVFSIRGRGTVAVGRVESGTFHIGQTVQIQTESGTYQTTIASLEAFRKNLDAATTGDNVGILLRDIERQDIQSGDKIQAL